MRLTDASQITDTIEYLYLPNIKRTMYRIILILALLLSSQLAHSQVLITLLLGDKLNSDKIEFGLDGGFNWSSISNLQSSDRLRALNLGFYFDIKMKERLYLSTGVLVKSTVGNDDLSTSDLNLLSPELIIEDGTYSQRLSYFHVPITAKYRFKNHFYVKGGAQLGLLNNARLAFEAEEDKTVISKETDNIDMYKRIDAGLLVGFGYKLKKGTGMNIGVKYYYGLANIYKSDAQSGTNDGIYLKMDIPIGAGKSAEKSENN